ncbi:MAG: mercury transporter [Deltaproteobacteria bacterium RIFOXYD12_FULL_50_9]|nr:MAG: mercury transporter [Deltaproteobacteria bacterium RIFOXYD12_FULL_50_9]
MTTIKISGMNCKHCVQTVTKALAAINGLENIQVSLEKKEATFSEKSPVAHEVIKTVIGKIGFQVIE